MLVSSTANFCYAQKSAYQISLRPTRAMIMTGTDHHIAGLGNLIEFTNYTGWSDFKDEAKGDTNYDAKPQRGRLSRKAAHLSGR